MKTRHLAHGYFIFSIVGVLVFLGTVELNVLQLLGCPSTVYIFFFALMLGDFGFLGLARICLIFWPCFCLAFLISYLVAVIKKAYKPLAVIAGIDVIFGVLIAVRYFQFGSILEGILAALGVLTSLYAAIVFSSGKNICQMFLNRN